MPKKRTYNFKSLQGTSTSKQATTSKDGGEQSSTVNERLSELRKLEGKEAVQKRKELAELVNQRSVPPNVRAVLGVPDSEPPKPKRGVRTRMPNRTPGPAPPQSWLKRPAWSLALTRRRLRGSSATNNHRSRPNELLRFARMTGDEPKDDQTGTSSLLHLTLKTTALNWDLFDIEDLPALVDIPLRLRLRLLSYLAYYGPPIDVAILDALTRGNEAVKSLDLAGLCDQGLLTLHRIVKFFKQQSPKASIHATADAVADSWDQEETLETVLFPSLSTSRFANLTHLSLSHSPPGASWRDLLSLSKHISGVTHFSLAYWPRPTLTPNLTTTSVSSQHSPDVQAGGSHYYSALDSDLSEPASLLRQLSSNLLCLQWLDLEGCTEWVPALAHSGERNSTVGSIRGDMGHALERVDSVVSIFVYNWKNLRYLNVSQGWHPTASGMLALKKDTSATLPYRRFIQDYLSRFEPVELMRLGAESSNDVHDVEKRKALVWAEREVAAQRSVGTINLARMTHGCKRLEIDHGWAAKR